MVQARAVWRSLPRQSFFPPGSRAGLPADAIVWTKYDLDFLRKFRIDPWK
jgi:hypothetical protein